MIETESKLQNALSKFYFHHTVYIFEFTVCWGTRVTASVISSSTSDIFIAHNIIYFLLFDQHHLIHGIVHRVVKIYQACILMFIWCLRELIRWLVVVWLLNIDVFRIVFKRRCIPSFIPPVIDWGDDALIDFFLFCLFRGCHLKRKGRINNFMFLGQNVEG